ncbi:amino acid adenylation domain-containing protein, partial [Rhodococcus yananensis]|uniref:amino acid adenylation domain-containing protein n=1 Tax=Rhodococcus yananensis TaxID=2879464 RepID=UPI001CF8D037
MGLNSLGVGGSNDNSTRGGDPADAFPLSPAQLGMWFAQHLDPSVPANIAQYVELEGDLDFELLRECSERAGRELQSAFVRIVEIDARPHQVFDPTLDLPFGFVDFRGDDDPRGSALDWMRADRSRPVDLLADRLVNVCVLQIAERHFLWYLRVHHLVVDGLGAANLVGRVAELYTAAVEGTEAGPGKSSPVRAIHDLELAYRDSARFATDRTYWAGQVLGIDEPTSLAGRTAAPAPISRIDAGVLESGVEQAVELFLEREGTTLATTIVAAFAAFLAQSTGQRDVLLSLPVAARTTAVMRRSGGMVSNVVPLRMTVDDATTVGDLLRHTTTVMAQAIRHQRYRHEDIVRDTPGASGQSGFFGPWINLMLFDNEVRLGSMVGRTHILSTGLIEDLGVNVYRTDSGTRTSIDFESNPNLYSADESDAHHDRFVAFLAAFVGSDTDRLVWNVPLSTADEVERSLVDWNRTDHAVDHEYLLAEFDRQVARTPDATALVYEGEQLTYAAFDARVSALARILIDRGVGPESRVGLCVRRSLDLLVGMYAIVRAGGAWVPIDPDHPAERTTYILESAAPACVVTTSRDRAGLPAGTDAIDVDLLDYDALDSRPVTDSDRLAPVRLDNTAYVIYTSGSTGRPKGVAVTHRAIDNQTRWMNDRYALSASDVYLQKTATTFDVSLWGFFMPLRVGATLVVATPDGHRDPVYVAETIARHRVTVTDFVPSMLTVFVANAPAGSCDSLEHVFVIGEALPAETAAAFRDLCPAGLHNLYGPTEAAVSITHHTATPRDTRSVPIGVPQWNSRAYVLDRRLRPAPIGQAGELYLAGVQLARGYLGRPDLTSDRFLADPFGAPGDRMYRTGDLVRWRTDGTLDYIGRTDFQVKFRGQRIELGEIEAVLLAAPEVSQAVVLVVPTSTGDQLVGYVVPAPGRVVDESAVTEHARGALPSYMVPAALVVLDDLPLNTSGKLDRKALPVPVFSSRREFTAPRTAVERLIAETFADVLGVTDVGLDDDFFELGGNSLVATQVVARIGDGVGRQVPVRALFEASTVGGLATRIADVASPAVPTLGARTRPDSVPLSLAQQRLWFLNRFDSSTAAYNMPFAVRLVGELDSDALALALVDVVERHETLRTVYVEVDGAATQVVLDTDSVALDLMPRPVAEGDVDAALAELAHVGFDVSVEPPVRVAILRIAPDEHILAMVLHHIAADGLSFRPLARDVLAAYSSRREGHAPPWAPLPVQYADYTLWQRETLGDESSAQSLAAREIEYWRTQLAGLPEELDLPTDRPRPAVASNAGARHEFRIDADIHRRLVELGRVHNASPFMVLHAAFAVLLSRLSGSEDIMVGSPVSGREDTALDDLIGMFVNTLVLRTPVDPDRSFADLVDDVRRIDLEAYAHSHIPFERLVEVLNPTRSQARHPLFQVALVVDAVESRTLDLSGVTATATELALPVSKFDLQLTLSLALDAEGRPDRIDATFEFATDLFDADSVNTLAQRFVRILDAVGADPGRAVGDIALLSDAEYANLTTRTSGAAVAPRTLRRLMRDAVDAAPDGIAVSYEGRTLTYRELDAAAGRLARTLLHRGVGPGDLVAIAVPRSIDSVLAVWAVARTGAGFVPVDVTYPSDRVQHMLVDSGAALGITRAEHVDSLPADVDWIVSDSEAVHRSDVAAPDVPEIEVDPRTVAYVIYTSGSTGLPKGVAVTHLGLHNFCVEQFRRYEPTPDSRVLHVASPSFDASVLELLLALAQASTLVVSPPNVFGGPDLAALIARERITHSFLTPSVVASMDPAGLDCLQHLVVGGEACPPELVARWARGRHLYNGYGPTETTIMTNISDAMVPGRPVTIGGPIRGMRSLILDRRMHPVPAGIAGELYLSGIQLARGYHARAGLTAERFVANPFGEPGERMYRTGDVATWTDQGEVMYLGRSDFQIKIRGLRVELGEIDATLAGHPSIEFAATVGHTGPAGVTSLVAYVLAAPGHDVDVAELSLFAGKVLPTHMVPAVIVVLDELPLTPVGKLDRRALPEPEFETHVFRAPTTPIEEIVANVFIDVLGVDRVGLDDDFFALGGNSLIATQVSSRLGAALDAPVPVRALFEAPTVAALAARVEQDTGEGARAALVAVDPRPDEIPLSLAQQRMWFLNRYDTESATYNITFALRMVGYLDIPALQVSVIDVVDRHESLRTVYPATDAGPVQTIGYAASTVPNLQPIDVRSLDELERHVHTLAGAGFDVTRDAPIRASLFRLGDDDHVLAFVVHHISADGWSMAPLARDVMIAYAARKDWESPTWPPLAVQYADYTLWQREVLGSEDDPQSLISRQLGYWRNVLADLPDQLDLPTDRPRSAAPTFRGDTVEFEIPGELHRAAASFARDQGATLFMVVHAVLAVVLSRLSGSRDIAIGTPVAGRGEQALDDLVGMFVNTLVLRTDVDPAEPFADFLDRAGEVALGAFGHADVPFERLVEVLNPARVQSRHPLFQVALSFQNLAHAALELPGLSVSRQEIDTNVAKFDLELTVAENIDGAGVPQGMSAQFSYATDLFDRATVVSFAERFVRVLGAVVADPAVVVGDAPWLS